MNQTEFASYVSKRGGVPFTSSKLWVKLIFSCLRECILSQNSVSITGVGEFSHTVRKGGTTWNPFTKEYFDCPDRDKLKFKFINKMRTDFYVAVRDGLVPSNVEGGFQASRKLSPEEVKERGYNDKVSPRRAFMRNRAKAYGMEFNPNDYGADYDEVFSLEEYERRKAEGTLPEGKRHIDGEGDEDAT